MTSSVPSVFATVVRLRSSFTCREPAASAAWETAPGGVPDESHSLTQAKGKNHAGDEGRRGGGQEGDREGEGMRRERDKNKLQSNIQLWNDRKTWRMTEEEVRMKYDKINEITYFLPLKSLYIKRGW